MERYEFLGIGIGPFNLSIAALASQVPHYKTLFLDSKDSFSWHPDLMFEDAFMQTSWLKDLVTPVDPTNPNSFLNYLVENKKFYAFLNTSRSTIKRIEFEHYCRWVADRLSNTKFNSHVLGVQKVDDGFVVRTEDNIYHTKKLCLGTGLQPNIPAEAQAFLGSDCFFARSPHLKAMDLEGKRLAIVGGGQTGIEILLNGLRGQWGQAKAINVFSRRDNLEPLDESPFVNEYFIPHYVKEFAKLPKRRKGAIVDYQKLASDGITPAYLEELYQELYDQRYLHGREGHVHLYPNRDFRKLSKSSDCYRLEISNRHTEQTESYEADVVIFATGFRQALPDFAEALIGDAVKDSYGRIDIDENFQIRSASESDSSLYGLNLGRHCVGISEPQVSLMAWRAGTILNHALGEQRFRSLDGDQSFLSIVG
ncbi:lysine N(6)-hydroxylase/L-ornithine N(5)-oxygenase family protein [Pseudobacteriovorax antillogorgiicola]|uniref:Lysine N6-hydroxylase n=1 Tax=Pseudobacteriovorax antillogorgiicola TaxID=1513793 RepID=A0A1Y6CVF3_9BACT|nr:SidA/IucD/PvdA family monooxygenase [Pseudobacteriovorax antillogorgiicola]TCS43618.1 lysine N6-hydroxylase [Pseudobacteriovorax antillogorgiicola]SMF80035.1 lysine N6-hydroxylase [Pseudobacteriovorax antillogorgiicola]